MEGSVKKSCEALFLTGGGAPAKYFTTYLLLQK